MGVEILASLPDWIGQIATTVTSLTIILGFYHKFIKKPYDQSRKIEEEKRIEEKELKDEEERRQIIELITHNNKPLTRSIDDLVIEIETDRDTMNDLSKIAEQNSNIILNQAEQLSNLDRRVVHLEIYNEITNGVDNKHPRDSRGKELD